jgi:hypothetical protein
MTISIPFASPLAGLSDFFTAWQGLHPIVPVHPVHPVAEVAPELADRLAAFFTAWTELRNALPSDQPVPGPLAPLLQRFFTAWKPLQTGVEPQRPAPVIEGAVRVADMTRFFRNFGPALQARAEHRRLGSGINVWEASGLGWDELRNSKVLAWLLDCRGTHGQGAGILAGLLDCIARKSSEFPVSANTVLPYWTRIELCPWGENGSRVDIEVDGDGLLLFIEVKIGAMETTDQLDRYLAIGRAKARDRPWGVIYLTRHGRLPLWLTALLAARRQRIGFRFSVVRSLLNVRIGAWRTFASEKNQECPEIEKRGFQFEPREGTWFLPWQINADLLAETYVSDAIEDALGPLKEALERIHVVYPIFVELVESAQQHFGVDQNA